MASTLLGSNFMIKHEESENTGLKDFMDLEPFDLVDRRVVDEMLATAVAEEQKIKQEARQKQQNQPNKKKKKTKKRQTKRKPRSVASMRSRVVRLKTRLQELQEDEMSEEMRQLGLERDAAAFHQSLRLRCKLQVKMREVNRKLKRQMEDMQKVGENEKEGKREEVVNQRKMEGLDICQ